MNKRPRAMNDDIAAYLCSECEWPPSYAGSRRRCVNYVTHCDAGENREIGRASGFALRRELCSMPHASYLSSSCVNAELATRPFFTNTPSARSRRACSLC